MEKDELILNIAKCGCVDVDLHSTKIGDIIEDWFGFQRKVVNLKLHCIILNDGAMIGYNQMHTYTNLTANQRIIQRKIELWKKMK